MNLCHMLRGIHKHCNKSTGIVTFINECKSSVLFTYCALVRINVQSIKYEYSLHNWCDPSNCMLFEKQNDINNNLYLITLSTSGSHRQGLLNRLTVLNQTIRVVTFIVVEYYMYRVI